ncbi:proline--tRNA ligase [Candidatus Pelagisphaera phototrophica]|uniref:proline--tRNA ligase n=1 Tax=Candidatus Pelagisphaera phototrophica TaxID=2684113 RepID=UPI0019EC4790|nr:proline--tRNA ligase [Candidatus Pelagisphaera phototrophica]QXD31510.1 proline--tRNA ligase [Candidatus Pelagisphaera phototrophica]
MQYWSKAYIPTLKESPAEAEIESHKLLLRAGLVRKIGGGLYAFLPLGKRVLDKVSQICREEMNAAGAIELLMPAVLPAEQWKAGPRWNAVREVMYSVSSAGADAKISEDPQYVLGPTHEEVITPLIGSEISSYRDLGKTFYQIQTKYRNEIRPRYGLMRAREFIMKDGYSFDESDEKAEETYHQMAAAYEKFFARCGLTFISVEADTGIMGGAFSHEFMVPAEVGDDDVVYCEESGYAANVEKATSGIVPDGLSVEAPEGEVVEFETPGATTINALAKEPYKVAAARQYKTLLYVGDDKLFAIVIRGCDDLQESKLGSLGYEFVRPATPDEIESVMGAKPGSLGVVNGTIKQHDQLDGVFADDAIRLIGNGVTGANKDGFHLKHVNVERDLDIDNFGDFRQVKPGEPCPKSGKPLKIARAIEVGHIFKLGTKFSESESWGAKFHDSEKQTKPAVMGCYGIGVSRTVQAVIEQSRDKWGIVWPWSVAPYQVVITVLDPGMEEAADLAEKIGVAAESEGADVLVDDRDERPGVKFKDADLIGIPLRVTIGGRGLKEGIVELKWRIEDDIRKVAIDEVVEVVASAIREKNSS